MRGKSVVMRQAEQLQIRIAGETIQFCQSAKTVKIPRDHMMSPLTLLYQKSEFVQLSPAHPGTQTQVHQEETDLWAEFRLDHQSLGPRTQVVMSYCQWPTRE